MNRTNLGVFCLALVAAAVGCGRTEQKKASLTVEIVPNTGRVQIKVVNAQPLADAVFTLGSRGDLRAGLSQQSRADLFNSLTAVEQTTTKSGHASLAPASIECFVVVYSEPHLWLASASDASAGKLQFNDQNDVAKASFTAIAKRQDVGKPVAARLRTAAEAASAHEQFDAARVLAANAGMFADPDKTAALQLAISKHQSELLLAKGEKALALKDYATARSLGEQARGLMPEAEQGTAQAFLQRLLEESGGELRSVPGGGAAVMAVAMSPDGRFLLSGGTDKTIKLWEAANGKEVRAFKGHGATVRALAFGPDGRFALSGSDDGTARLWEVESGTELHSFDHLGWKVTSVAFSADGVHAVSGCEDSHVKLWNVSTRQAERTLNGHGARVTAVAFAPGGRALSGSEDDSIILWDAASGSEVRTMRNGLYGVYAVAVSSDGRFAVSGGADKLVKLWELSTGREVSDFAGHSGAVRSVALGPDGRFALSAGDDGTVRLWNVASGTAVRTFTGHNGAVNSISMSSDGRRAVSGGADGSVKVWQLPREVWPAGQ